MVVVDEMCLQPSACTVDECPVSLSQRWLQPNNSRRAPNKPGSVRSSSLVLAVHLYEVEQRVMPEFLSKMDPGAFIGLVSTVGAFSCAIIAIVMGIRLEYRRVELAAELKRDMLERGMSAEEIRMVMESGSRKMQPHCKGPIEAEV
jgi:hypothetical protein